MMVIRAFAAKRAFDLALSLTAGLALAPVMALIAVLVRISSRGSVLYWSERIGKDGATFWMPKFRTMRPGAPNVATHLLTDPGAFVTRVGRILRKTSLDELPQLWSILLGDMSFVGPRPALFNQEDLIALRKQVGVDRLVPGLTGWAQVNGRDELPIPQKVRLDEEYLKNRSFGLDLRILWLTLVKAARGDGVTH